MVIKSLKRKIKSNQKSNLQLQIEAANNIFEAMSNHTSMVDEKSLTNIATKRNEEVLMIVNGAALLEMKKLPGKFEGGSTGISFRLTDRITIRGSKFAGQFIPGPEIQAYIDTGKFLITSKRAFFIGSKKSKEFPWDKVLGYTIQPLKNVSGGFALYLPLVNREKISAIGIGNIAGKHAIPIVDQVNQRMAFALALHKDGEKEFLSTLKKEIQKLESKLKEL
jgi:hypothetical protein